MRADVISAIITLKLSILNYSSAFYSANSRLSFWQSSYCFSQVRSNSAQVYSEKNVEMDSNDILRAAKLAEWREMMVSGKLKALGDIIEKEESERHPTSRPSRRQLRRKRATNYIDDSESEADIENDDDDDVDDDEDFNTSMMKLTKDLKQSPYHSSHKKVIDWRSTFSPAKKHAVPTTEIRNIPSNSIEWRRIITKFELVNRDALGLFELVQNASSSFQFNDVVLCHAVRSLARLGHLSLAIKVHNLRPQPSLYVLSGNEPDDECGLDTTIGLAIACYRNNFSKVGENLFTNLKSALTGDADQIAFVEAKLIPESLAMHISSFLTNREAKNEIELASALKLIRADILYVKSALLLNTNYNKQQMQESVLACCNAIIRHLGKIDFLAEIFELLQEMKDARIMPNQETYEFVANAAVKEVIFECKAGNMKSLPSPGPDEVLFAGRSNVGKSSLVNMLVNRKAIAPTSSKPGFTTKLNFYSVNAKRDGGLNCRFVDVPGLGFAEVESGQVDSWRSTLQRYLTIRAPLRCIFHLIDANTGPEKADISLIDMIKTANIENRGVKYVVVLTKTDKASSSKLGASRNSIKSALLKADISDVEIVLSSSKNRLGRDDLWGILYSVLKEKPEKKADLE